MEGTTSNAPGKKRSDAPLRNSPERFFRKGRLMSMPAKRKNVLLVLSIVVEAFERNRTYTEQEVNAIVLRYHDDHCILRRALVNERFLQREATGSRYWRAD